MKTMLIVFCFGILMSVMTALTTTIVPAAGVVAVATQTIELAMTVGSVC